VWWGVDLVSQQVTIESLPDNVLLEIFYFYLNFDEYDEMLDWGTLAHVCQRWRYVLFGSPIRLNLQLRCTGRTPVRKLLNVLPEFPLDIYFYTESEFPVDNPEDSLDNLVAALEQCDRVCQINITSPADSLWEEIITAMEGPFPALTYLYLNSLDEVVSYPDTFLNGSAPCLQHLELGSFSFPSLPRLLSSTSDLKYLCLRDIPDSGYIPSDTMVGCLSTLPKLESLIIAFESPTPRLNRVPPPPTRFVLPALTLFRFEGVSEYLEFLAARMDAPLLDEFAISLFYQPVFDIPQIVRFLGHLKAFRPSSLAMEFNLGGYICDASIFFSPNTYYALNHRSLRIKCRRLDWQVVSLTQICNQILPFRSCVDSLIIRSEGLSMPRRDPAVDPTLWIPLFHSFPSVQSLRLSATLVPFIAPALKGLTAESAAEVFPSLHSLSIIRGPDEDGIGSFIAARQQSSQPVALVP
jgi:F-box-like